ncbi:IS66 family transposase [Rhizobium laguerreae]|uniref:IS66 family transposase n=1 Tax=Rhizobium laguerreae TaxID=1076926 RepID=UPI0036F34514
MLGLGGQHAERILQGFASVVQVDGYAGYNRLIAPDRVDPYIQFAYCWAHARRKLVEITSIGTTPIAEERRQAHWDALRRTPSDPRRPSMRA